MSRWPLKQSRSMRKLLPRVSIPMALGQRSFLETKAYMEMDQKYIHPETRWEANEEWNGPKMSSRENTLEDHKDK